ncbi:MAG: TetR/AcrR family transcriptional regulator [Fuerstiella sp.]|nr:TetR/AcrR family transcriptional regulator [Fuerstiella sp.]MCP4859114.1 TetR/AcrR family transcriptional regulator [Fuerstiella sp.]
MPAECTPPRKGGQTPESLARIAFRLFAEHGVEKVSLGRVAQDAGVTKGSVYSHFDSKNELFAAACQMYYRGWQRKVQMLLASEASPYARIEMLLRFSVQRCVLDRQNRVFTTELFALSLRDSLVRAGWTQFYSSVREQFVALVEAAQASGEISAGDARRRVNLMLCTLEGLKLRATYEPEIADAVEIESVVNELLELLGVSMCEG